MVAPGNTVSDNLAVMVESLLKTADGQQPCEDDNWYLLLDSFQISLQNFADISDGAIGSHSAKYI